jgi:predicted DNA-binding protein
MEKTRLVSLVFYLPREKHAALKELSKRTRIRQAEYLREAIADLLTKYEDKLDGGSDDDKEE